MSLELYEDVMKELRILKFSGLVIFSGYCEPTLHPKIKDLIILTKKYIPNSTLVINSNGDFLNKETIKRICHFRS